MTTITTEHAAQLATLGGNAAIIGTVLALTVEEGPLSPGQLAGLHLVDKKAACLFVEGVRDDLDSIADWVGDAIAVLNEVHDEVHP